MLGIKQMTEGTKPSFVARQLGHVNVKMVFKIYGKFISEDYLKPKPAGLKLVGS